MSNLNPRDLRVVESFGRYPQQTTKHICHLHFNPNSPTPCLRSIRRLVKAGMLAYLGTRPRDNGIGPAVYALGRRGWWYLKKGGEYTRAKVNPHTLHVADVGLLLELTARDGIIKLDSLETEHQIGHSRADLYVDVGLADGFFYEYALEVQITYRRDTIRAKVEAYTTSFNEAGAKNIDHFPTVVFVVWDEYHAAQIKRHLPDGDLFKVWHVSEMLDRLQSP